MNLLTFFFIGLICLQAIWGHFSHRFSSNLVLFKAGNMGLVLFLLCFYAGIVGWWVSFKTERVYSIEVDVLVPTIVVASAAKHEELAKASVFDNLEGGELFKVLSEDVVEDAASSVAKAMHTLVTGNVLVSLERVPGSIVDDTARYRVSAQGILHPIVPVEEFSRGFILALSSKLNFALEGRRSNFYDHWRDERRDYFVADISAFNQWINEVWKNVDAQLKAITGVKVEAYRVRDSSMLELLKLAWLGFCFLVSSLLTKYFERVHRLGS